ncbi:MAG: SapC family protein [Nitrosomonadales bacterium]|nr:SapC family protein [Nitrosomonadales bacterium]
MTTLLFYEKPVPLISERHLKSRIEATGDFGFSASTNSIPLAVIEFVDAAKEYPIAFTGEEGGACRWWRLLTIQAPGTTGGCAPRASVSWSDGRGVNIRGPRSRVVRGW